MFDFVQKHKRLVQGLLFLIFLPFAFFGIDSYFRFSESGQAVARVGDYSISQQEFNEALRQRQRAIQSMVEGRIDPAMLDNPELRYFIVEGLIQRRLLLDRALRAGMTLNDAQLQSAIGEQPLFQNEANQFSFTRYEQYLRAEGMTPIMFEARVRQDLILQQFTGGYAGTSFVPRTVAERIVKLSEQRREVSQHTITAEKFVAQVRLEPEAASKYYDANQHEFQIPEQVRVEYVVLSPDAILPQIQVSAAEVDATYQQQVVAVAKQREEARTRIDRIRAELRNNPGRFEELVKLHSQDPGSAGKGGDLGFFGKGVMTKAFEEAAFKLKENELSPVVESEYGFHIIKVTGMRTGTGAKGRNEERRASHILIAAPKEAQLKGGRRDVELELKRQAAQRKVTELADQFSNVAYEQSESLKPAAELIKVTPQQSGWITRARADNALLGNPRLLAAIFSDEVLKNRRNTEAIEVAPHTLVAARVMEHKPASMRPLADARAALDKMLALREAGRLAAQEGRRELEQLRQGKDVKVAWSAPQLVSRTEHKGLPEPVLRQAFRADVSKLPAYAGVEHPPGSYTLLRVTRVQETANIPSEQRTSLAEALRQAIGREALSAYVASLKQKTDVTISRQQLDKKP